MNKTAYKFSYDQSGNLLSYSVIYFDGDGRNGAVKGRVDYEVIDGELQERLRYRTDHCIDVSGISLHRDDSNGVPIKSDETADDPFKSFFGI